MLSKRHPFLMLFAGLAGKEHQKIDILGRLRRPKPHHCVKCQFTAFGSANPVQYSSLAAIIDAT
jgi:hypothetical protein